MKRCPATSIFPSLLVPLSLFRMYLRYSQLIAAYRQHSTLLFRTGAGPGTTAIFEILEKFGIRIKHHHVVVALETRAISFKAAIKLVKLRILTKCLGINLRCLG